MSSRRVPGRTIRRGASAIASAGLPPFDGNFAALVPGAYQVIQSDRGITYGGSMRAGAGSTSTATMNLTGAVATTPVPVWLRLSSGTTADIYYDGAGLVPAMAGVPVAANVPTVLTGAGTGLSITPSPGTFIAGDTWRATCAALADQTAGAKHYSQAVVTRQPLVGPGLNGKPSLRFAGAHKMTAALTTPTSGNTPLSIYLAFSPTSMGGQAIYTGCDSSCTLYSATGNVNQLILYPPPTSTIATTLTQAPTRVLGTWAGGSITDSLKVGSSPVVTGLGADVGINNMGIGGSSGADFFCTMDLYLMIVAPAISPAQMATLDAALNSWAAGAFIV